MPKTKPNQHKYLCPFGDEHKFKDSGTFIVHLVQVHLAIVNVTEGIFSLRDKPEILYKVSDYEVKQAEEPKLIIPAEN